MEKTVVVPRSLGKKLEEKLAEHLRGQREYDVVEAMEAEEPEPCHGIIRGDFVIVLNIRPAKEGDLVRAVSQFQR